jgi:hypothetical protein
MALEGKFIEELPGGIQPITNELKVILEGVDTGYNTVQALATFFNKHSHTNKTVLDKFSVSGSQLLFDGEPVAGVSYKGYFVNSASLLSTYPAGQDGWYATVGSTDTIWLWDTDTTTWVDSGNAMTGTAAEIHAAASKTTPVDGDEFGLVDSADSYSLKRITWSGIKTALKSFFDTIYQAAGNYLTSIVTDGSTISGSGTAGDPLTVIYQADITRQRSNPTITGGNLVLDFNAKNELIVTKTAGGGIDVSNNFAFGFLNSINAEFCQGFLNASASATITLPAGTITGNSLDIASGKYQFVFAFDGFEWHFAISETES